MKGCWTSGTFTLCPPLLLHVLSLLLLLSRQEGKHLGIHCTTDKNFVHWCQILSCFEETSEHSTEKLEGPDSGGAGRQLITEAWGTQEGSGQPITGTAGSKTGFPEKGL